MTDSRHPGEQGREMMSDHLPDLKMGHRVRIMQTTEMEHRVLANLRGTYGGGGRVILDGSMEVVRVGLASLMRITPEQELRWASNASPKESD